MYYNIANSVWKLIIQEKICVLPVRISSICANQGITLRSYSSAQNLLKKLKVDINNNDACSAIINDKSVIFYKELDNIGRCRFSIAHELGHIVMGHTGRYKLVNREPNPSDNPVEKAANMFAARLLAPACVLWGCGVKNEADVAQLCNISHLSAKYRMERMELLYGRDKFLTSPLERKVYEQFKDFIDANKL